MLVREDTGKFLSQRDTPRMCLLRPQLVPDDAPSRGTSHHRHRDAALILHPPPGVPLPPLRVPLDPPSPSKARTATVWGFTGAALDEGDEAADWCTRAIAAGGEDGGGNKTPPTRRVRLVRHAPELNLRTVDPNFALPGTTVGFADEFPILAATEGSLADLNARLKKKDPHAPDLQMARFRPNLVFSGGEATDSPWADDGWARVRVSGGGGGGGDQALSPSSSSSSSSCELAYVKPCSRCKVTTVDPESGALTPGEQPLPALRAFRSGSALGWDARRPAFKHAVFFAWNVQPVVAKNGGYEAYAGEEAPLCVLERGSRAEVVARRAWE
jgi:uncharacterized protein YcbX